MVMQVKHGLSTLIVRTGEDVFTTTPGAFFAVLGDNPVCIRKHGENPVPYYVALQNTNRVRHCPKADAEYARLNKMTGCIYNADAKDYLLSRGTVFSGPTSIQRDFPWSTDE